MAATHPMDGLVPLKGSRALSLPEAAHYARNARRAGCHRRAQRAAPAPPRPPPLPLHAPAGAWRCRGAGGCRCAVRPSTLVCWGLRSGSVGRRTSNPRSSCVCARRVVVVVVVVVVVLVVCVCLCVRVGGCWAAALQGGAPGAGRGRTPGGVHLGVPPRAGGQPGWGREPTTLSRCLLQEHPDWTTHCACWHTHSL